MSTATGSELPNLGEIFARVLQRVPREEQPLLIAVAERMAADRYRTWASDPAMSARRAQLLACADREEEIASRVEALFPGAAAIQRDILAKNPDLEGLNRTVFETRPLLHQLRIQAQGERLGVATWRSFAKREQDPRARDAFLACAELEEVSAVVLESIVRA